MIDSRRGDAEQATTADGAVIVAFRSSLSLSAAAATELCRWKDERPGRTRPREEMGRLTAEQEWLATHYGATVFQFETDRLEKYCPVEFGITCRYLERYVPNSTVVADVGVGVGHYAECLARRGCSVYLVAISVELLQAARQRLERAGLGGQVQEVRRASATDLGWLTSGSLDAVLMLGPFYHLRELHERRQAVSEARRILKPHGILFAAAVNQLAYLRNLFREKPEEVSARLMQFFGGDWRKSLIFRNLRQRCLLRIIFLKS